MLDLHCDETDDPLSRHVETLAGETHRLGLGGRVAGSHLTSMHSMDNYYVSKLLPLIAEAGVAAIPNPLINIILQGRHDTYPKRRGLTRVKEMRAHGIAVGWGQDCVLDPWYSLGTADMLDVAFMGLHVAQMTSPADMRACFDMVTEENARDPEPRRLRPAGGRPRQPRRARRRRPDRGAAAAGRRGALVISRGRVVAEAPAGRAGWPCRAGRRRSSGGTGREASPKVRSELTHRCVGGGRACDHRGGCEPGCKALSSGPRRSAVTVR